MATQHGDVDPNVGFGPFLERDSSGTWVWKWGPWHGHGATQQHTCLKMTEQQYEDARLNNSWSPAHLAWLAAKPVSVQGGINQARQAAPPWDSR